MFDGYVSHMQVQANTTSVQSLVRWLIEVKGLPPQRADVTGAKPDGSWTAFTNQDIKAGEVSPYPLIHGILYAPCLMSKGNFSQARSPCTLRPYQSLCERARGAEVRHILRALLGLLPRLWWSCQAI